MSLRMSKLVSGILRHSETLCPTKFTQDCKRLNMFILSEKHHAVGLWLIYHNVANTIWEY